MSHPAQMMFVNKCKNLFPDKFLNKKILEIGSANINGSVRVFFENCEYLGLDVAPGLDVDIVIQGQEYKAPDNHYDTIISCECFEHNPFWKETFANMIRMTKSSGLIIMTCATTGRPEHGTSRTSPNESKSTEIGWDYYCNLTEKDFWNAFDINKIFNSFMFIENSIDKDLYFYGIKK